MRFLFLFIFLFSSLWLSAQSHATDDTIEVEIKVGDSIEIGDAVDSVFKHLDFIRKTRWTGQAEPYDTATGFGFQQSFLTGGDFDLQELPVSFRGRRFQVLGLEVLTNKNTHQPMHVVYLRGPEKHAIIWVDFYEAVEAGEIKFIPKE